MSKRILKLTIHRGTHEIGGSCVELATENTRILIDVGLPLVDEEGQHFNPGNYLKLSKAELVEKDIAKDIPGLYKEDNINKPPDAIFSREKRAVCSIRGSAWLF